MKKITKYIIGIVLLLAIVVFVVVKSGGKQNLQTETAKLQDVKKTVLSTGTVKSGVDLDLSFKNSGVVKKLPAKVGLKVKEGDVLAELDNSSERAVLLQSRGGLAQARANLQKVRDGASSEEVRVSQVALDNAVKSLADTKKQQNQLVENARRALMSGGLEAVSQTSNLGAAPSVSGTYMGSTEGSYKISLYQTGQGLYYSYSGLETSSGASINAGNLVPLGTKGLSLNFSASSFSGDTWIVNIPNTQSSVYVTNSNAYKSALETRDSAVASAESSVSAAEAALALKKAGARSADLSAAEAQVVSAEGQVAAALASLENTIIRAPATGTVTKVDVKLGEIASPGKAAVVLQDIDNLFVESNISEANISSIALGQTVEYSFDALGSSRKFYGKIVSVDPASTLVSGVVNYKITASIEGGEVKALVKSGMTANLAIEIARKNQVVTVPLKAIVSRDNQKFIRVVLDTKKPQDFTEASVTLGLEGDGGVVEVVSGLNAGQQVVVSLEKK